MSREDKFWIWFYIAVLLCAAVIVAQASQMRDVIVEEVKVPCIAGAPGPSKPK